MSLRRWLVRLSGLSERVRRCFLHALFERKLFRRCPPLPAEAAAGDRDCQATVDLAEGRLRVMVAAGVQVVERVSIEAPEGSEARPAALEGPAPHLFPLAAYRQAMAEVWAKADEVVQYGQASREISHAWLAALQEGGKVEAERSSELIAHIRLDQR